jgi:hypothetical protein
VECNATYNISEPRVIRSSRVSRRRLRPRDLPPRPPPRPLAIKASGSGGDPDGIIVHGVSTRPHGTDLCLSKSSFTLRFARPPVNGARRVLGEARRLLD